MTATLPRPPALPREHGAWVMVALPLVLGLGLAGPAPSAAWLVPPAALLAFLAHYALVPLVQRRRAGKQAPPPWWRRRYAWGGIYLAGAAAAFAGTVALTPASHRVPLLVAAALAALGGGAYFVASCLDEGRRVSTELLGMAGMSLTAAMTGVAGGVPVDGRLAAAPAMALGYFVSTLAFVRAYGRLDDAPRPAVAGCLAAHVALLAGLAWIAGRGWLSPWWAVAFVPVVARTAWGLVRPPRNLKALGLREVWVALSFTVIATLVVVA